jgi:hypothetical protein
VSGRKAREMSTYGEERTVLASMRTMRRLTPRRSAGVGNSSCDRIMARL